MEDEWYGSAAKALTVIGGINWGLVGLANFDAVKWLLGSNPMLLAGVYVIVGVSAVYTGYLWFTKD